MKKKISLVQNLRIHYLSVKTSITVLIGSLYIAAQSVAAVAAPFDITLDTISPFHSEFVSNERLPENYSDKILSLVAITTENKLISHWNAELDSLAELQDDWDGESSAAVQPGAVEHCRCIIEKTRSAINQLEEIYPTPFGSLCMEWSLPDGYVNAEIAETGMAFFRHYDSDTEKYIHNFQGFSDEVINDLKNYLS